MNAYHALQIARDARLEGRIAEYEAVLSALTEDGVQHVRHRCSFTLSSQRQLGADIVWMPRPGHADCLDVRNNSKTVVEPQSFADEVDVAQRELRRRQSNERGGPGGAAGRAHLESLRSHRRRR